MSDDALVLKNLSDLHLTKQFVEILEVKYFEDKDSLKKLRLASKKLDSALMNLAFDIEKKSKGIGQKDLKISLEISGAIESITDFDQASLKLKLHDLVGFSQNYENDFYDVSFELDQLKSKVLTIIAERFN